MRAPCLSHFIFFFFFMHWQVDFRTRATSGGPPWTHTPRKVSKSFEFLSAPDHFIRIIIPKRQWQKVFALTTPVCLITTIRRMANNSCISRRVNWKSKPLVQPTPVKTTKIKKNKKNIGGNDEKARQKLQHSGLLHAKRYINVPTKSSKTIKSHLFIIAVKWLLNGVKLWQIIRQCCCLCGCRCCFRTYIFFSSFFSVGTWHACSWIEISKWRENGK